MAKKNKSFTLAGAMGKELGIDLGTASTIIYMKGHGVVLREPSLVAVDGRSDEILAAGKEARDMVGRTTASIRLVRPIQNGVVADFDAAVAMLRIFIRRAAGTGPMNRPRIVIGVPAGSTEVEKTAAEDTARQAGGSDVSLLEAPLAALLGAGVSPVSPKGVLTLSYGAGHTEAAVSVLGQVVSCCMERTGGQQVDDAIARYIRRKYSLQTGEAAAEEVKLKVGSAFPVEEGYGSFLEVRGRSVTENLPKNITVHGDEIRPVVAEALESVVRAVIRACEDLPAQLAADVLEGGIFLFGGGASLAGLGQFLTEATGLKVTTAERPLDTLAEGLGMSLGAGESASARQIQERFKQEIASAQPAQARPAKREQGKRRRAD